MRTCPLRLAQCLSTAVGTEGEAVTRWRRPLALGLILRQPTPPISGMLNTASGTVVIHGLLVRGENVLYSHDALT